MGLRNRGPYAPQRQPVTIDYAKMMEESDRARAQVAVVEEQVRANRFEERMDLDPISQLVKRCHVIELRQDAFEQKVTVLGEQVQTIIDMLRENK